MLRVQEEKRGGDHFSIDYSSSPRKWHLLLFGFWGLLVLVILSQWSVVGLLET